MAKKKAARTRTPKPRAAKKAAKKAAKRAPRKSAPAKRRQVLRQAELTGMEQVRHVKMDRLCESLGDTRDELNRLRQIEATDTQAALDYMLAHNVDAYHHHGIELVLRRGTNKLMVRKHKEITAEGGEVDAVDEGEQAADDAGDEGAVH